MVHFFLGAASSCIVANSLSRLSTMSPRLPLSVRLSTFMMLFHSSLVTLCSFLTSLTSALGHTFLILRVAMTAQWSEIYGPGATVRSPVDCVISLNSKSRMLPDLCV